MTDLSRRSLLAGVAGLSAIGLTPAWARVFEDGRIFSIDYAPHPALGTDPGQIEVRVTTSAGEVASPLLQANPATGGLRPDFTLKGAPPVAELRAELWRGGQLVAEVWLNRWLVP